MEANNIRTNTAAPRHGWRQCLLFGYCIGGRGVHTELVETPTIVAGDYTGILRITLVMPRHLVDYISAARARINFEYFIIRWNIG